MNCDAFFQQHSSGYFDREKYGSIVGILARFFRKSAKTDEADAFIFVTAEYGHSYPAPLRNALEYLVQEWAYKPAGIVSYGGISAGTRAMKSLQADLCSLQMVPLYEAVNFPLFEKFIHEERLYANGTSTKAAQTMLSQLARWTKGLKSIREDKDY